MTVWILSSVIFVLLSVISILSIMLRGSIRITADITNDYKITLLPGTMVEEIRILLINYGFNAITPQNVLDLIYTIRAIQLGHYEDTDPFIPADPYDGLEEV